MEKSRNLKYYNELDDEGRFEITGVAPRKLSKPKSKKVPLAIQQFVQNQDDSRESFTFTYKAARFEEGWLLDSLGYFYEQKWISDVLRMIKAGKEASVYLCQAGEQVNASLVAAKVYRPRMLRNLRDDHIYREGRIDLDEDGKALHKEADIHAILTRSRYGEQVRHQSWIAYEYTTLQALYEAEADVPRPYEMAHNAILMDYVGDLSKPAPALNEISLETDEARSLFERVLQNIKILLAHDRVHGDLSAYNILYWDGNISLIDFPQVISPQANRSAYAIFERDVTRVCEYFIAQGLRLQPRHLAADLWTAYGYHVRPEIHPQLLDANDPADRQLWNHSKEIQ
jgi:RIO kinase 1